ncbi:GNAT family N-acetyltransferase, partial [bacterium]|nr:GNAT family N-acetyltransferase [bacterium]
MQIKEVVSAADKAAWHKFQRDFYRNDPNFSAPFEKMIEAIFTPGKNEFYENGDATRFLLYDDQGQIIGRTAAFINGKKAYTFKQPTGGMGFFECVNDQKAADMLFDACRDWLRARGMQAMDGPINFGENDNYWGLLVEGFEPSGWGMNYNPPYYKELFE